MLKNNDIKTFIFRNRKSYNVSLSHNYQEVYVCSTIDISKYLRVMVMVLSLNLSNISIISWRSILLVGETCIT